MKKEICMKKKSYAIVALFLVLILCVGCSKGNTSKVNETAQTSPSATEQATTPPAAATPEAATVTAEKPDTFQATEIQVFIAASLSGAMEEIKTLYNEIQPNVTITYNADSSGTLLTQVQEGYECDIFFSAAPTQLNTLEDEGYLVSGTRKDLLKNQVVLIAPKGSKTLVTGFEDMAKASSMALAGGSVPVGNYTRKILMNLGVLDKVEDPSAYTSTDVSKALGDIEINECSNVSKVAEAIKEGSNEIGTVYYSDAYSILDSIDIIAYADANLSGDIIYPVAQLTNKEADDLQSEAAKDFLTYLESEEALKVFENYMFITK